MANGFVFLFNSFRVNFFNLDAQRIQHKTKTLTHLAYSLVSETFWGSM